MAEDRTKDELEPGDGKVLPEREMMSLVSTDPVPVDPVYATLLPPGGAVDSSAAEGPPMATLPVEGPETEAGTDDADRQETFQQSESASAS